MGTLRIAGGHVLKPDLSIEREDVLIDRKTGTIVDVGSVEGGEETLDATDGLVAPSFCNAHTHISLTLQRGFADDKPLQKWLEELIWPVEPHLTGEDIRAGTELGILEMIKSGTTAFADMHFYMSEVADVVKKTGMRALLGHGILTESETEARTTAEIREGLGFARTFDGTGDGRIRTAVMPHALYTVGEESLIEIRERTRVAELPLHFHANETTGEVADVRGKYNCRPIEAAHELGLLGPETFVAHAVHLNESEIALLADTNTGVVHCPASNMKLASGMAPLRRLVEAGVTVGLGTDSAASNNTLDMFQEMRDAALLGKLAADDASAATSRTVFRLATSGSASLLGFDSGRVEPGANADLMVVDLDEPHLTPRHDLVSHLVYAANGSDVRHTICNGEVLMRDREVTVLDEDDVCERAEAQAHDLLVERAGME